MPLWLLSWLYTAGVTLESTALSYGDFRYVPQVLGQPFKDSKPGIVTY